MGGILLRRVPEARGVMRKGEGRNPSRSLTLSFLLSSFSAFLLSASTAAANFSLRGDAIRFRRSEASLTRRAYISADFCAQTIRFRPIMYSGTCEGQVGRKEGLAARIEAGFTPALLYPAKFDRIVSEPAKNLSCFRAIVSKEEAAYTK